MPVRYTRVGWQDAPSTDTPIDAANLNHMDNGILALSQEVDTELDSIRDEFDALEQDTSSQIDSFKEETSTQISKFSSDITAMQNGLPGMISDKMDDKFGDDIGDNVTSWLTEHVNPAGSAVVVDDTLTIQGAAADAKKTGDEITGLKDALHLFREKTNANSRWPRFALNVVSGTTYILRVLNIESETEIDICMLTQGSTVFSTTLHDGLPLSFTPSGDDPVYLAVRYASAPSVTPTVTYQLEQLSGSSYVMASMTTINDNNKTGICNGSADNIPINTILRVTGSLTNPPFNSGYYDIVSFGKYVTRTNGDVQVAISELTHQIKTRQYLDSWGVWEDINQKGYDFTNTAINAENIYCVETKANSRWPNTVLPCNSSTSYIIKIIKIISADAVSECFINQGDTKLTPINIQNGASQVFTTDASDNPVILTVKYANEPSVLPKVVFQLIPANYNRTVLTASELLINNDNKTAICGGDADSLPFNTIIAKSGGSNSIDHEAFLGAYNTFINFEKYFTHTTGDFQIAIKPAENVLAHRSYSSGAFSPWRFMLPVSRFSGQKFSFIGDSITTFNQDGYKISGYKMAYPYLNVGSIEQTWWMRVISASGANLEVNAAWSGSCVTNARSEESYGGINYPTFYERCNLLGNPDTIFVALGTNDSIVGTSMLKPTTQRVPLGEYDFNTAYTNLSESTFRTAYIKGIKALQANYPTAKIVCVILYMNNDYDYAGSVRTIAEELGCSIVECNNYVIGDNSVHPNVIGMRQISSKVLYPETAVI